MCLTATKTQQQFGVQSGTSSTTLPSWATHAGEDIYQTAANYAASNPYQAYSGPTGGTFGPQWTTATNFASDDLGKTNPDVATSSDALRQVLDQSGATAKTGVADLMSPYTEGVLAPTLRKIGEAAQNQNNATAGEASMAGAFGDSGFGLERALNARNTQQNIGDATASAYDRAFTNAQQTKNTALNQVMQAASGLTSNGAQTSGKNNALLTLLSSMGSTEEGASAAKIINDMIVNGQKNNGQLNQFSTLQAILRGAPMDTTTSSFGTSFGTGSSTQPDNTPMQVGGSILSKALS